MLIDANLLLYAVDEVAPEHERARTWLTAQLNGERRIGLPWASLTAFLRISTHHRASRQPLRPEDAWGFVDEWLAAPTAWIPGPTERHATVLGSLVRRYRIAGNLLPDAHLAAIAIEHGLELCSVDTDFARFREVRWTQPADGSRITTSGASGVILVSQKHHDQPRDQRGPWRPGEARVPLFARTPQLDRPAPSVRRLPRADHPEPLVLDGEPIPTRPGVLLRELQRAQRPESAAALSPSTHAKSPSAGTDGVWCVLSPRVVVERAWAKRVLVASSLLGRATDHRGGGGGPGMRLQGSARVAAPAERVSGGWASLGTVA